MRAYIYVGGKIDPEYITEHPREESLLIAADSGYENARLLGVTPQLLLGDMDSVAPALLSHLPPETEVLRVPAEKDETDTQLALAQALARGADDIVFIGGLSGRLDHTLSNLGLLEALAARGVRALFNDGFNRVRYIRNDGLLLGRSAYRYFSLLCADEVCRGVTVEGGKYPLRRATLRRAQQYAVSNEMTGNCALIEVRRGGLFVIESR